MTLKPIEKNGEGRYKPNASGIVFSLGGTIAAIALAGNAMWTAGQYTTTQNNTAEKVNQLLEWKERQQLRTTRMEIDLAEIRTILQERTDVQYPLEGPIPTSEDYSYGF